MSQFLTLFFADDHPTAILNCIRALGGYTHADSPQTLFDTDTFVESKYLEKIHESSGNLSLSLNWYVLFLRPFVLTLNMHHLRYDSFKVCTITGHQDSSGGECFLFSRWLAIFL